LIAWSYHLPTAADQTRCDVTDEFPIGDLGEPITPPGSSSGSGFPPGSAEVTASFTDGSGTCMSNPADFTAVLIVTVHEDGTMAVIQPGMHDNFGAILPEGFFEVSTGKGEGNENFVGLLMHDFSAEGIFTWITTVGTCTWTFIW
jgi:hypothetical protein